MSHLAVVEKEQKEQDRRLFRKANEVICPRVARGGTFSLLPRKLFNVLLYHTQEQGAPGHGAPDGDEDYKTFYWIPLPVLVKDAAYNSDDAKALKDALTRLQDIKIITDNARGFASDVLIPRIRVIPQGRGRATMIGWALDPATEKILRCPEIYTSLSIYYKMSLRTNAGISLYETAKRYATNPSGLSLRETWEWWHDVLTGLPVNHPKPEYKYFKRDTLKPAIDEVNTTDVRVELIEHKVGRKVTHLQFRILREPRQAPLERPALHPNADLISRIEELGIIRKEAEELCTSHEEKYLRETIDWIEARVADVKLPPVSSKAGMFRAALRGRFAQATAAVKRKRSDPPPQLIAKQAEAPDPIATARTEKALVVYDGMEEGERAILFGEFSRAHPALAGPIRRNPDGRLVRNALAIWLARRNVEPK
jgi:hypothetical protein